MSEVSANNKMLQQQKKEDKKLLLRNKLLNVKQSTQLLLTNKPLADDMSFDNKTRTELKVAELQQKKQKVKSYLARQGDS